MDMHFTILVCVQEQKFLIGVVLMVPCYAVESVSFFGLNLFLFRYKCLFFYFNKEPCGIT